MTEQQSQDPGDAAHEDDDYAGSATLVLGGTEVDVEVQLRGHFQPIDGYYHWYGRVRPNATLTELAAGRKTAVEVRTSQGSAIGEISDADPWGRYRLSGTSTPPFATPTSLDEIPD